MSDDPPPSLPKNVQDAKLVKTKDDADDVAVLIEKLSLSSIAPQPHPISPAPSHTADLAWIAAHIQSRNVQNIIVMSGAGISTSAGIPDYRSPGSGLYDNLQKYNLPYPEAIFDLSYFKRTPSPFYTLARDLFPGQKYRPTVSHFFIKLLHEKGLLLRHYTQNIDGLEREAGMSSDLIVEAHGSFWTGTCFGRTKENDDGGGTEEDGDDTTGWTVLSSDSDDEQSDDQEETEGSSKSKKKKLRFRLGCGRKYSQSWLRSRLFAPSTESVNHPTCDSCGCLVKPDITFFGESLPHRFHSLSSQDFGKCDLLLVMGTSLTVHPFASLIGAVNESVPRLLMNRERAGESGFKNGFQFISNSLSTRSGAAKPTRDKLFLGSVDDGCIELTRLLGWTSDLERLMCASQ